MPNVRHGSTVLAALFAIPLWACGAPKTPIHLATATSASASASASATVTPPRPPCEIAADQRARVPKLLEAGKLDRTVRVIERADALCPSTAPTTWAAHVTTLIELGRFDDANKLVPQIEASGLANLEAQNAVKKAKEFISQHKSEAFSEDAKAAAGKAYQEGMDAELAKNLTAARAAFVRSWSLYRPNGQALFAAGLAATALGQPAEAQRLLDRAVVELEQREGKKVVLDTPNGFPGRIHAIALQKNAAPGKAALLAVTAGDDVLIVDTVTWRVKRRHTGHDSAAFSPNGKLIALGKYIALAGGGFEIHVCDATTGAEVWKLKDGHPAGTFSPDGALLASSFGEDLKVWDLRTGAEKRSMPGQQPIAFVGNRGKRLATYSLENTIHILDLDAGIERRRFPHGSPIAFSDNGESLALATEDRVELWDVATGLQRHRLPVRSPQSVAFSHGGELLVSAGLHGGSIFDVKTGAKLRDFGSVSLANLLFSSDGTLIIGSDRFHGASIRSWDVRSGLETVHIKGHTAPMNEIVFSPDMKLVGAGADRAVLLWSTDSGELRRLGPIEPIGYAGRNHENKRSHITFSPNSKNVAGGSVGNPVHVWDIRTGIERHALAHDASSAAFSPDGTLLATASAQRDEDLEQHDIRFWEVTTGLERHKIGPETARRSGEGPIAFVPNGKFVTANSDHSVPFWAIASGRIESVLGAETAGPVAFSPDSKVVALTSHGNVEFWELDSRSKIASFKEYSKALAFSPDGTLLASASAKTVRLWDVVAAVEARVLVGHMDDVNSVAFSPNGKLIGSASSDGSLRFWSTKGEPLLVVRSVDDSRPEWKDKLASYAFTTSASPLIEFLGPDADSAREFPVCRVGVRTFPFALCRERVEVRGLFAKVLAGDMSYLDP